MRCAASAIDCNPELQNRLMLKPAVLVGSPARSAIARAMLPPVVPSLKADPMITSSTSAGSMPARATAAFTECAPKVAPYVMLNAPFQLLPKPVRAVDTMTASVTGVIL
jgi:hypothetical protein